MNDQIEPKGLTAAAVIETHARDRAVSVEQRLTAWYGRCPTVEERFAALVPTMLSVLGDRSMEQVDALLRCLYADLLVGVDTGKAIADRVAEVSHG